MHKRQAIRSINEQVVPEHGKRGEELPLPLQCRHALLLEESRARV